MTTGPLVLDSNLLVLWVVGAASKEYIPKHKRLTAFSVSDFDLLVSIVARTTTVLVTPNTLSEASNLLGHIAEPARTRVFHAFKTFIDRVEEKYVPSRRAADQPEFFRLGLADSVLLTDVAEAGTLLTTDLALYLAALARGAPAHNFNHLRDLN